MSNKYQPFVIEVGERTGDHYPVAVRFQDRTPWKDTIPADLPLLRETEIQQALRWLERGFIDRDYAEEFGKRLFQTLFPDAIREGFRVASERATQQGENLRLVLILPPALQRLPWELMYDAAGNRGFLARSSQTPLVRHFADIPLSSHQLPQKGPLRVLIVTASPSGNTPVSTEAEIQRIKQSLAKHRVPVKNILALLSQHWLRPRSWPDLFQRLRHRNLAEVDVLEHTTYPRLQECMRDSDYHIVHFVGHGYTNQHGGYLVLETEEGDADPISADDFAEVMDEPSVNMVVLNACQTADAVSFFNGVAQAALQRGVPAVVGMQVPILDSAAIAFAQELYGAWAAGEPLESALSYARRLIRKTTRGAAADWGIPVLYMGPEEGLTLHMPAPSLRWPWPVRSLRWLFFTFLSLLGIVGTLFTIPEVNRRLRTEIPVIRCVFPYPMENKYDFNIVITKFAVLNEKGTPVNSKEGSNLADFLYQRLNNQFEELNLEEGYEIRSPIHTCPIRGNTRDERENAAAILSERIDADIVIYGVITQTDEPKFVPEFYVNYEGFKGAEGGEEITGQYRLGNQLPVPKSEDLARGNGSPAFTARVEALSLITIGLSYYAIDNHERALEYFKQAENTEGWLENAGKEVVYVLIGNAGAGLTSQTKTTDYLTMTLAYYTKALTTTKQNYARAQLGKAGVLYIMALGGPSTPSRNTANLDMLEEAAAAYSAALNMGDPPKSANIDTKVHFGLGQTYYIRAMVDDSGFGQAQAEFEQVTQAYEDGNEQIANYAGHAYARLGAIAWLQGDTDAAIGHYERATELTSPYFRAYYYATLGEIHAAMQHIGRAIEAYTEATGIAEFYGDAESAAEYSTRLSELQAQE